METNFKSAVKYVFQREAGFVNDPKDPGGPTNLGITIPVLRAWRQKTVSTSDIKNLTLMETEKIYHKLFWHTSWCEHLPSGIDLLVFDMAVNSGVDAALQRLDSRIGIGIKPRHIKHWKGRQHPFDPETLTIDRLSILCTPAVIAGFCEEHRAFYRSLKRFSRFGKGWLNRVDATQKLAMHLWVLDPLKHGPAIKRKNADSALSDAVGHAGATLAEIMFEVYQLI